MAELVLQISSLSFQYKCSRIKLNILKLYVHLLEMLWNLFSSIFLSLFGFHTTLADKTKIDNCYSFHGQVFPLGIRLMRFTILRSAEFIQRISFFSLRSLRGIILELVFLSYPKLRSWFFNEQRQFLMRLHPLRNKWQLIMHLHPLMDERQLTSFRSFKIHHVLALFGGFFLSTNYGRWFASPLLTHTWLIENDVLPCLSHLVMIQRVGERDSLFHCHYPVILAYYYRPLTVKCIKVSYFLVTIYIYIYIYIYIIPRWVSWWWERFFFRFFYLQYSCNLKWKR